MRLVDHFERGHAYRTARSMHEFDLFRQQLIDPVFNDAVCLAAANLHEYPGTGHRLADLAGNFLSDFLSPVFVDVLHAALPSLNSDSCPSSSRSRYVRSASSPSTVLNAKPT